MKACCEPYGAYSIVLIPCLQSVLQHLLNSIEAGGVDVSNVNADIKQLLTDVRDLKVCNPA